MSDPSWAVIVEELYENGGYMVEANDEGVVSRTTRPVLSDNVNLSDRRFSVGIHMATRYGLVEEVGEPDVLPVEPTEELPMGVDASETNVSEYELTSEGFQIAHERKMSKRKNNTNRMLMVVTVGLFIAALIQALASFYSVDPRYRWGMAVGTAFIVGLFSYFMYHMFKSEIR